MSASRIAKEIIDNIDGGLSSGKSYKKFDQKQLAEGILVELEHTKDIMIALEIAMDHLSELPDYYTRLKKIENE